MGKLKKMKTLIRRVSECGGAGGEAAGGRLAACAFSKRAYWMSPFGDKEFL